MLELLNHAVYFFRHMPDVISGWSIAMGPSVYVLLFVIIFSETGLLILPFLPGDSLLFALGALCAANNTNLKYEYLLLVLPIAALSGDFVNYNVGKFLGRKFLSSEKGIVNKKHLQKTQGYFERYGPRTICLARFIPIVRTYTPFVAGVGQMKFTRFLSYSIVGAYAWIVSVLSLGYFFGNIPSVKTNFHYVILGIIIISILPMAIEFFKPQKSVQHLEPKLEPHLKPYLKPYLKKDK